MVPLRWRKSSADHLLARGQTDNEECVYTASWFFSKKKKTDGSQTSAGMKLWSVLPKLFLSSVLYQRELFV